MILANAPGSGTVTSQPIIPTTPFAHWDTLIYDHLADAAEALISKGQAVCPAEFFLGRAEIDPDSNGPVGSGLRFQADRFRQLGIPKLRQLALGEVPFVLRQLRMIEIEESKRLFTGEDAPTLPMERHERCGRVEDPAQQIADPGPPAVDAALELGG